MDSGTTETSLDQHFYSALIDELKAYCERGEEECGRSSFFKVCFQKNTEEDVFFSSFPSIFFYFASENVQIEWKPEDYLFKQHSEEYCLGVSPYIQNVLAGSFFKNYDVFFDNSEQKIGFWRADCKKLS